MLEKYDEAALFFTQVLAQKDGAQQRTNRGVALLEGGKPEKAMDDFAASMRLDSTFLEAWVGYGNCYLAMGNYVQGLSLIHI